MKHHQEERPLIPAINAAESFVAQTVLTQGAVSYIVAITDKLINPAKTIKQGVIAQLKSPVSWAISGAIAMFAGIQTYRDVKAAVRRQEELEIRNDVLEQVARHEGVTITPVSKTPECRTRRVWRDDAESSASHADRLEASASATNQQLSV